MHSRGTPQTSGMPECRVPRRPHLVVLPGGGQQVAATGGISLTRRGRLALLALVVALAAVLGMVGLRGAGAAEPPRTVTVEAGQTLSEVAATELPSCRSARASSRSSWRTP